MSAFVDKWEDSGLLIGIHSEEHKEVMAVNLEIAMRWAMLHLHASPNVETLIFPIICRVTKQIDFLVLSVADVVDILEDVQTHYVNYPWAKDPWASDFTDDRPLLGLTSSPSV